MDTPFTIACTIGAIFMIAGFITQLGTSKAERMGKVAVDDKKKKRIAIGYVLISIGILIVGITAIILSNIK